MPGSLLDLEVDEVSSDVTAAEEQRVDRAGRWPVWVVVALIVVAFPYVLYQGRQQWFVLDDWDFLSDRQLTSVSDLMRSHNGHWSTIPIVTTG